MKKSGAGPALANNPRLFFWNEPFASVDAKPDSRCKKELAENLDGRKKDHVLGDPQRDEAIFLSERIGVMTAGRGKYRSCQN